MKANIEAVLFDLDGTLVDTAPDMVTALNQQLLQHNLPEIDFAHGRNLVSQGSLPLIQFGFGKHYQEDQAETLREEYLAIYATVSSNTSALFSGMSEVLDYIEKQNLPWGIVTNKPAQLAIDLLKNIALFDRLATFYGGDTLSKRKPDPDQLNAAQRDLNIPAQNIIYFGDDQRDIQAAKAANMQNAVVNYGYINTEIPPYHWHADFYIDRAIDIIELLE